MIQYLLPGKEKGLSAEAMAGESQKRRGKINGMAHKMWKVYMGHPRKVVRIIVFFACSIAVLFQLAQCFRKLTNPPISTRSRVMLNSSMSYPSITICRTPSYKKDVLKKYGLGTNIKWTSEWKNFPFKNATLQEFWDEATYSAKEVIGVYGLNRRSANVEIKSNMYYVAGQCHTLVPLVETSTAGLSVGYSLLLKHTDPDDEEAGWEVFVHEAIEPWTETGIQRSGSSEGVWMDVEEELHLKITTQHIKTISQKSSPCENDQSYSVNECQSLCRWMNLASIVGCSAPWMASMRNKTIGKKYKECNTYQSTRELVLEYLRQGGLSSGFTAISGGDNETQEVEDAYGCQTKCLRPCYVTQYTTFVVNRKSISGGREKRSIADEDFSKDKVSNYRRQHGGNEINHAREGNEGTFEGSDTMAGDKNCTEGSEADYWATEDNADIIPRDYILPKIKNEKKYATILEKNTEQTVFFSKLNVFYTSKMVTVMEENWGYDFSQFVADAGGSLGFLLGMSVVGAVALLEQLAEALVASTSGSEEPSDDREKGAVGRGGADEGCVVPYESMKNKF